MVNLQTSGLTSVSVEFKLSNGYSDARGFFIDFENLHSSYTQKYSFTDHWPDDVGNLDKDFYVQLFLDRDVDIWPEFENPSLIEVVYDWLLTEQECLKCGEAVHLSIYEPFYTSQMTGR